MRKRSGAIRKLLLLLSLAAFFTIGDGCTEYPDPGQYTQTPPDQCSSWDTDCDGISNAIETNSANAYLNLDPNTPDTNHSIAHGTVSSGWLENGFNLVNTGTGYYHYLGTDPVDIDDWGVLHLINMIEGAGRDWHDGYHEPPRIGVGDMSLQNGGKWKDHTSHQNGLDVDVRYVRNDGRDTSLNIATDTIHYDPGATAGLMGYFIDNADIHVILYDSLHAGLTGGPLLHWPGHSDHFHVRIEDPDGTGN